MWLNVPLLAVGFARSHRHLLSGIRTLDTALPATPAISPRIWCVLLMEARGAGSTPNDVPGV